MRRLLGFALGVLVAATIVAACGSTGDRSAGGVVAPQTRTAPSPPASDAARARRALVRLADMPEGWREQKRDAARLDCGGFEPFAGAVVVVRSGRLTRQHVGVEERIALYPSAAAAARALRRLDSRRGTSCLRHELRRHVTQEAGALATPAELMREERLTVTSHAKRYMSTAVGNYGQIVGIVDAVHARAGRSLAALMIISSLEPPDVHLYDSVVKLVTRRLEALRDD